MTPNEAIEELDAMDRQLIHGKVRVFREIADAFRSVLRHEPLMEYLKARRKTIEASIAAEQLAGNKHKEECERTALAEITALEQCLSDPCSSVFIRG